MERLVDPRLPGTDFMDTFLVTYRYFTTGKFVLQSLIDFYHQLEEQRTGKPRQLQKAPAEEAKDNDNKESRKISKYFTSLNSIMKRSVCIIHSRGIDYKIESLS